MSRAPYPLDWPAGWSRTPPGARSAPKFDARLARGRDDLLAEVRRLGGFKAVITSNLPTRRDGLPYADGRASGLDPGVAVWWNQQVRDRIVERVMACDRWSTPGANMRALALSIFALRGLERWGGTNIVERAFSSFGALPPAPEDWRAILGFPPDLEAAIDAYHRRALAAHPDRGGSHDEMARLNAAWAEAKKAFGPAPAIEVGP